MKKNYFTKHVRHLFVFMVILCGVNPLNMVAQSATNGTRSVLNRTNVRLLKTANEDGSITNPFTNIDQVTSATPNGSYYFNFGGNTVVTRVEDGWVLIANDAGAPVSQDLQEVTNLDATIRGIVSNTVLANLGNIDNVKIKSSDAALDVVTNSNTIINRIKSGTTIHQGQSDNGINDSWSGASSANITVNAACISTYGTALKGNIVDVCGFFTGMRWIPINGHRSISADNGNVPNNVSFGLWVQKKTISTITSLSTLSGACGSTLVINGTYLAATQTVTIGGTQATINSTSNTSVSVTVNGGTTGIVVITTPTSTASSSDIFTFIGTGNLGSNCNPFTYLNQVSAATPDGMYYFNFGGNIIQTRVENGYILIANDAGTPVSQNLQEVTNLDVTVRGILSNTALSNSGTIEEINIRSSDGAIDVKSTNAILINRLIASQTLHQGQADNVINDSWTGVSAANIKEDASCTTSQGTALKGNIIHTCGAYHGVNWIPNLGLRRINDQDGNVASSVSFGLWVKAKNPPTLSSVSPLTGCPGTIITIQGTDFEGVQSVKIGGKSTAILSSDLSSVTVLLGDASGTVTVTAKNGSITSTDVFTTVGNSGQSIGTACNPFTSIEQITTATPNGKYSFLLNGNFFETEVHKGWVLVANDINTPISQKLGVLYNIDQSTRGILSPQILSNLGQIGAVRIRSTNGALVVISTDSTIISRVKSSTTLHKGVNDNAINDTWVGFSATNINADATCVSNNSSDLSENIIHTCGNAVGTNWIPSIGLRRINYSNGNVADNTGFGLWVRNVTELVAPEVAWTGAISSDWNTTGNWSNATVPTSSTNVFVAGSSLNQPVINTTATCNDLILEPKARITLNTGNTLSVIGNFVAMSDASGTATVIDNGRITVGLVTEIQQYVDTTRNYISSPVAGAKVPIGLNYLSYVEPGNNTDFSSSGSSEYWKPNAQGSTLTIGKGYVAKTDSFNILTYFGVLNNENISIPLTRTSGKLNEGFNLIGNPYLSYLDWQAVSTANQDILSTLWFRTKNTTGNYMFSTINIENGFPIIVTSDANSTITNLIPPMQGFWIRLNQGTSSSNLVLNNSMRTHIDLSTNIPNNSNLQTLPMLRLQLSNSVNTDEAVLYFNANAVDGFDRYDSPKMFNNNSAIPELYFESGNEMLVIDGMKVLPYNVEIPLGVKTSVSGQYSIKASEFTNFVPGTHIILIDKLHNNIETDLTNTAAYTFNAGVLSGTANFSIEFRSIETLVENLKNKPALAYVDMKNRITIVSDGVCHYEIYNVQGQKIARSVTSGSITHVSSITTKGVYVVKLNKNNKQTVIRLIIQ